MERSLGMVGVVKSYLQVGELVRSTEASGGMGRGIVAGLHMVRPNGVELTTEAVTLARDLVRFGVVFNDVHDNLEFAQSKGGKFESDCRKRKQVMDAREANLRRLDIPIVNTYIDDALLLESLPSGGTMKDFINYREMMNAIPLVSIARVVWRRDLSTEFEKLSTFDEIEQRYCFVRSPESEAEVGMAILWNLAMLGQLRDDQHDESYDRVRGIRTFATELPAEEQDDLRYQYMNRARDLGFGPALVFDRFTNAFARNKVRATKYISRLGEGVTEQIIQKRGVQTLQEVWGMQGRL